MTRPQLVVMLSGLLLILVGTGLVVAQMTIEALAPDVRFPTRSLNISAPGARAAVETTYVGLVMIVTGAVLEVVGYVASGPWKPGPPRGEAS